MVINPFNIIFGALPLLYNSSLLSNTFLPVASGRAAFTFIQKTRVAESLILSLFGLSTKITFIVFTSFQVAKANRFFLLLF